MLILWQQSEKVYTEPYNKVSQKSVWCYIKVYGAIMLCAICKCVDGWVWCVCVCGGGWVRCGGWVWQVGVVVGVGGFV